MLLEGLCLSSKLVATKNDIYREIQTLKLLCLGMITEFLISDSLNGVCRIEKYADCSSHKTSRNGLDS